MERIAIVGCGGSGKTHLARELAERLDLPLTHLDAVYYDREWNPRDDAEFRALQAELVARPRWIIEGNYAATLPVRIAAADTIILLDLPARTCLLGVLQRRRRFGRGQNPALGVYNRINWNFIRYILGYRRAMLPRIHRMIADHAETLDVVILSSRPAIRQYLKTRP
jgi:adenylate kinase family enzyme